MNQTSHRFAFLPFAVLVAAAVGCAGAVDPADSEETSAAAPAKNAQGVVADRLERASRKLDVGSGAEATADLEAVRDDPTATPSQRDEATLALSRALEAKGEVGEAIRNLEALIGRHGTERSWPLAKPAESALRRLLTGREEAPQHPSPHTETQAAAPFAGALAKYFPEDNGSAHVIVLAFGGDNAVSDRLGTFNVGRVLREAKEQSCPLCDVNLNVWTSSSRSDDWMGILRMGKERDHAVLVYFDSLDDKHIPAHFDPELPMPVAEIDAHLTKGEGVIAAKERAGSPPAILIAAPRGAQLADVERVLAQMKTLPLTPVVVPVSADLRPQEIQDVCNGSRKAQRACFGELLSRSPAAAGKITLKIAIRADGSVREVTSDATSGVRDQTFTACMEQVAGALTFPATGNGSSITVPVRLSSSP